MAVEQRRIQQEIDAQRKKLFELESSPVPTIDQSRFTPHHLQTAVTLKLAANRLGDQIIHVMRPADSGAPHSVTSVTIDRPVP